MTTLTDSARNAAAANLAAVAKEAAKSTAAATATPNALAQLGANFNQFLQLLLTQVQNQDPTNPTNTDEFTTELVQFTGVQEQVNANNNLSTLINLQQSAQVEQAASLVGRRATVSSNEITLQNGAGEITFNGTGGQQIGISILDTNGNVVRDVTFSAGDGTNTWAWDGKDNNGNTVADGAYPIAVETQAGTAAPNAVPFSVIGTTTGVSTSGTTTLLQLGSLDVGLSSLQGISQ